MAQCGGDVTKVGVDDPSSVCTTGKRLPDTTSAQQSLWNVEIWWLLILMGSSYQLKSGRRSSSVPSVVPTEILKIHHLNCRVPDASVYYIKAKARDECGTAGQITMSNSYLHSCILNAEVQDA